MPDQIDARIAEALFVAQYAQIDGEHHKMWVIDQMLRKLLGDRYDNFIATCKRGDDGPDTYEWDVGIAP
jgi:hypothetical protein